MTIETAEKVRAYFSELEIELRAIVLQTPIFNNDPELEGYIDLSLKAYYELLVERMLDFAERAEYEKALAIQRFTRARLNEYISKL